MLRVANQQLSTSVSLLQRYGHQFSFLWVFNGTYILVNCSVMSPFFCDEWVCILWLSMSVD